MHRNLGYRRRDAAREPIIIPRWMLSLKYLGFVVLGTCSAIIGIPSLQEVTWRGWVTGWSVALCACAAFAFLGSLRAEWETTEKLGVVGVTALISAYTFAQTALLLDALETGDEIERRVMGLIVLGIINMMPLARAISLLTRTGLGRP